jgi:hypothetical protein
MVLHLLNHEQFLMAERMPCCVPFCRRTRRNDGRFREWICAIHWRAVPRRLKAYKRATQRRAVATLDPQEIARANRAWERCKRVAIEKAGGLG